jgi:hypothetical protein
MQEAEERRKRLKAIRYSADESDKTQSGDFHGLMTAQDGVLPAMVLKTCSFFSRLLTGTRSMMNPLLEVPSTSSPAPFFSFYR